MIESSVSAWLFMLLMVVAASATGLCLIRRVAWSEPVVATGVPVAFALGLAPFLLGLLTVLALTVLPGFSHLTHAFFVVLMLVGLSVWGWKSPLNQRGMYQFDFMAHSGWERTLRVLLALLVGGLVVNTLFVPLTQNDALEYATVGRLLYDIRDISAYPALDPQAGESGFYGPWTHPPLYVALIYLSQVLQGHADAPGLMRLLSPWCALAATLLVFALGSLKSKQMGLFAAVVFLSTPLFFLGADSALIDSLPILGLSLILAAVASSNGVSLSKAVLVGLVLGGALWTHSVAILFLPLTFVAVVFFAGYGSWRQSIKPIAVLFIVAALVAIAPYIRNLFLFGSVISDNPAVFAMAELAWDEYFSIARGIEFWADRIQYGILKGLFATEAYSFSFWFMGFGLLFFLVHLYRARNLRGVLSGEQGALVDRVLFAVFGVVLCFWAAAVVSTLLGIDLMIKNERYLLALLPAVALLAGYGLEGYVNWVGKARKAMPDYALTKLFFVGVTYCIVLLFLLQVFSLVLYRWRHYDDRQPAYVGVADFHAFKRFVSENDIWHEKQPLNGMNCLRVRKLQEPENLLQLIKSWLPVEDPWVCEGVPETDSVESKLSNNSFIEAVNYLKRNTPESSLVFSLRPADMYYAERRMISYLDPRLLGFYREQDVQKAVGLLKELGVDYLHMPNYALPPIYNSALQEIVADPDLTELLVSYDGNQIYSWRQSGTFPALGDAIEFGPGAKPWYKETQLWFGGRKSLLSFSSASRRVVVRNEESVYAPSFPLFSREVVTALILGIQGFDTFIPGSYLPVEGEQEYRLDMSLSGHGYIAIVLVQLDEHGRKLDGGFDSSYFQTIVGDIVLGEQNPEKIFKKRFITHPSAKYLRVKLEHRGVSRLKINKAALMPIMAQ